MSVNFETYRAFLGDFVGRLKGAYGEGGLLACCLFGSVARGEARPDSDIDLLIVHRDRCEDPLGTFMTVLREVRASDECRRLIADGCRPDPYPVFLSEQDLW